MTDTLRHGQPNIRAAASRTLLADLAALFRRSEAAHDMTMRELVDPLPLRKAVAVLIGLNFMPGVSRRRVPWCAAEILDELARRRGARR